MLLRGVAVDGRSPSRAASVRRGEPGMDAGDQRTFRCGGRAVVGGPGRWCGGGWSWLGRAGSGCSRWRVSRGPDHGLLPRFADLAGESFEPSDIDPRIIDFYENTSRWRMDLWSEWSPVAWPSCRAIVALWSQRLQQSSLPMRPLDVSYGMDSAVVHLHDHADTVVGSAWLRTMRKSGATTYSSQYGTARLPGSAQPSVRVVSRCPTVRCQCS